MDKEAKINLLFVVVFSVLLAVMMIYPMVFFYANFTNT